MAQRRHEGERDETPSAPARRAVFASMFTPTWGLGLLLFACMFLPCYRGCDGEATIYGYRAFAAWSDESVFFVYYLTWPFFFGLIVMVGTLWLAVTGSPRPLWWGLVLLVVLYCLLLVLAGDIEKMISKFPDPYFTGPAVLLVLYMTAVWCCCRSRFAATMWLQGGIAVFAAYSVSVTIPALHFADGLLFGGKLALAASAFLIVTTTVQWLDGERALNRARGESPLRLSLKSMFLLMLVGAVACAWVGLYVSFETLPGSRRETPKRSPTTLHRDDGSCCGSALRPMSFRGS